MLKEKERLLHVLQALPKDTVITFDTNFRSALWEDPAELSGLISQLSKYCKILFVTDTDDKAVYGERTSEEAIQFFLEMGFPVVIYRKGEKGCIVTSVGERIDVPAVKDVTVIDSTGAGDAFNAGFLLGSLRGMDLRDAATLGNAVASCTLHVRGGLAFDFTLQKAMTQFEQLKDSNSAQS